MTGLTKLDKTRLEDLTPVTSSLVPGRHRVSTSASFLALLLLGGCGLTSKPSCGARANSDFPDQELVERVVRNRSPRFGYDSSAGDPVGKLSQTCCSVERVTAGLAEAALIPVDGRPRYVVRIKWTENEANRRLTREYYETMNSCGVTIDTSGQSYYES